MFHGFAQSDRDGERLVLGVPRFDHRHGAERRIGRRRERRIGGALPPEVGRRRRAQRFRDEPLAPARFGKLFDRVAGDADARQQRLQRELRMAGRGRNAVTFVAADQAPGGLVEIGVEAGEHHGAVRQTRDRRDQIGGRRNRAGRAGDDHRRVGLAREPRRLRLDQRVAPRRRLDKSALAQDVRPGLARDLQEFQRQLPIRIERFRDEAVEPVPRHAAHGHVVDQPREIVGQRAGRRRRLRDQRTAARAADLGSRGPGHDQAREQQPPLEPAERRRQGERVRGNGAGGRFGERDLVLVDIADGDDARQDRRVAVERIEKSVTR